MYTLYFDVFAYNYVTKQSQSIFTQPLWQDMTQGQFLSGV